MKPKGAPAQAEHYGGIGVGQNAVDLGETESSKPRREPIFKEKTLPPRRRAHRGSTHLPILGLPRFPASPLPRLHSP
jgi:hypothetical protein